MLLSDVKGIGPATAQKYEKLGITTVRDLLYHFPSRYIDRRKNLKVFDLKFIENDNYHCIATVDSIKRIFLRGRRDFVTATFSDDTGYITANWFNNPYVASQLKDGDRIVFSGNISKSKVMNPKFRVIEENDAVVIAEFGKFEPVYPETKGLKSNQINKAILEALEKILVAPKKEQLKDLPAKVLKKERLVDIMTAIRMIHFPQSDEDVRLARDRFGFEEIYNILVQIKKRKKLVVKHSAPVLKVNQTTHDIMVEALPFQLTDSQQKSLKEIFSDLQIPNPMQRLLNGDVGAGKTIVAALASWQVVNNGYQVIILAPTGVLANQHYLGFKKLFDRHEVKIVLSTSDTRQEADKIKMMIENSDDQNHIFIGTHALFHRLDMFRNVGLLVIDEQHKFGVKQRELLATLQVDNGGEESVGNAVKYVPHVLSMSATPIPRSLALTLFGDLYVSFLEGKPEGRKRIISRIIENEQIERKMYAWIKKEIDERAAQVYVVCPLIEESKVMDAKSAVQEYERLKKAFPDLSIELLHGKIKQKEKDDILMRFKDGSVQILVSTSVIEVGIDNPNATIMLIEGAERFGLAQLHQIRGRVGRSEKQSYCFLKPTDYKSTKRLEFFASTDDGFKVAEYDLQMRGPGEVYGEAQSGLPNLRIANIMDIELIQRVKKYF